MANGSDDELRLRVGIDASGADSGAAQAGAAVQRVTGPMTEAQAAAQKWSVSLDVAQAALDRLRAQDKAEQVARLAMAMREAAAANQENAEAAENATAAEEAQTGAQEDSAESAEKLNAIMREHQQAFMRNAFYVHRLAEGFKDLSLGGRAASQGLMDISESLQYMLGPEVAIYAAMAQVVAMLALLVTAHHNRGEAAKEAAEAEKGAAQEASDAFAAQVQQYQGGVAAMIQSQADLLKSQQESTSEIAKQGEMLKTQAELNKEAALLKLQESYTTAMSLATPEQQKTIERRYQAAKADIEGQTTVNIANLAAQDAALKASAAKDKLAEQEADLAKNTKALSDAREQQAAAAEIFAKYGVIQATNDKGEPTGSLQSEAGGVTGIPFTGPSASNDVLGDLKEATQDLRLSVASLRNQADSGPPSMFRELESPEVRARDWEDAKRLPGGIYEQLSKATAKLAAQESELRDLENAQGLSAQAQAILGDKDLQKKVQEAPAAIFQSGIDVNNAQTEAAQKAQAASQAQEQAALDAANRKTQEQNAEQQARQEALRTWRDNELNAQKARIQAQLDATPEGGKGGLQRQLADLDNQELVNKANDKLGVPIQGPASPSNPYGDSIDSLNKRLGQLQDQQRVNPDAAKYLNSLIDQVFKSLGTVKAQSDQWDRSQGEQGPLLTPEQLAQKSIRDLVDAQTASNTAKAKAETQKDNQEEDRSEIEQLKKEIEARPDHASLEPLLKAAEGGTDLHAQVQALQAIFNQQVSSLISIQESQQQLNQEHQQQANDNTRRIERLERNRKNNHQS